MFVNGLHGREVSITDSLGKSSCRSITWQYIGKNSGNDRIYVVTGDSGNGLTHGVIAGRLIADEIQGIENPWASLYDPKRKSTVASKLPSVLKHDMQINTQYKRFVQSDITDVEELSLRQGGVLNPTAKTPQAAYKDENGKIHRMSALCSHMKGVGCWNNDESLGIVLYMAAGSVRTVGR